MELTDNYNLSYFNEPSLAIWESELYRVYAYKDESAIRLDIERKDGQDGITWDQMQTIKNACGFEDQDAIEFFPKEVDVINTGNLRHLYVFFEKLPLVRRL